MTPEFSRTFDARQIEGRRVLLTADAAECAALAKRFDLVRVERLEAEIDLTRDGPAVNASGTLDAAFIQSCAVSAEDLSVTVRETMTVRFVPARAHAPDEEIELSADELDEIEFTGALFDLGEAVAQSLALTIDPFATGPGAEAARRSAALRGDGDSGPFAALKALRKD